MLMNCGNYGPVELDCVIESDLVRTYTLEHCTDNHHTPLPMPHALQSQEAPGSVICNGATSCLNCLSQEVVARSVLQHGRCTKCPRCGDQAGAKLQIHQKPSVSNMVQIRLIDDMKVSYILIALHRGIIAASL